MAESKNTDIEETDNNMKYYNSWKSVPENMTKSFNTGTFKGTDIKPQWRYECLTRQFGTFGWRVEITRQWAEEYGDDSKEVKAYCNINLYLKDPETGEWSMPMEGTGGNTLVFKNGRVNDEGYKMARTDAISNACQNYGIAADIYMGYEPTKYAQEYIDENKKPAVMKEKKRDPWAPTIVTTSKKKEGEDIVDIIYNNTREGNIRLIQDNLRSANPDSVKFRGSMVAFVKEKGKQTYQSLDDNELVEFLINELGK